MMGTTSSDEEDEDDGLRVKAEAAWMPQSGESTESPDAPEVIPTLQEQESNASDFSQIDTLSESLHRRQGMILRRSKSDRHKPLGYLLTTMTVTLPSLVVTWNLAEGSRPEEDAVFIRRKSEVKKGAI
jgi:hypothetical protein